MLDHINGRNCWARFLRDLFEGSRPNGRNHSQYTTTEGFWNGSPQLEVHMRDINMFCDRHFHDMSTEKKRDDNYQTHVFLVNMSACSHCFKWPNRWKYYMGVTVSWPITNPASYLGGVSLSVRGSPRSDIRTAPMFHDHLRKRLSMRQQTCCKNLHEKSLSNWCGAQIFQKFGSVSRRQVLLQSQLQASRKRANIPLQTNYHQVLKKPALQ